MDSDWLHHCYPARFRAVSGYEAHGHNVAGVREVAVTTGRGPGGRPGNQQAMEIISSARVREAFDLSREPQHVRDRYGPDVKLKHNYQFGHT